MTATAEFVNVMANPPRATDKVKRDQWGRYRLPHPETGKEQTWTRATTIANTLADRRALENWGKRNVALGIGARNDLYAQAAAAKPEDKDTLGQIVRQAEEAASAKAGANFGSALHRFTERIDNGETIVVPEPWAADVAAYVATMQANAVTIVPGWLERVLLVPEIDAAGTCDRLCDGLSTLPMIGDLKTGKDVIKFGMTEIALQLAIYAHATHWYDPIIGDLHDMPKVDQTSALVMHLPVGQARCTLYTVDIAAGWEAVQLAIDVRKWRQRKDLAQIINAPSIKPQSNTISAFKTPTETRTDNTITVQGVNSQEEYAALLDRTEWVRDRVQAIKDAGHAPTLAREWSRHPDIPTFPKGGPRTNHELDLVIAMCETVEQEHQLPFGVSDPTIPETTKSKRKLPA